eukprot:3851075-Pyramimonas_sp.AAC.1
MRTYSFNRSTRVSRVRTFVTVELYVYGNRQPLAALQLKDVHSLIHNHLTHLPPPGQPDATLRDGEGSLTSSTCSGGSNAHLLKQVMEARHTLPSHPVKWRRFSQVGLTNPKVGLTNPRVQ